MAKQCAGGREMEAVLALVLTLVVAATISSSWRALGALEGSAGPFALQ